MYFLFCFLLSILCDILIMIFNVILLIQKTTQNKRELVERKKDNNNRVYFKIISIVYFSTKKSLINVHTIGTELGNHFPYYIKMQ